MKNLIIIGTFFACFVINVNCCLSTNPGVGCGPNGCGPGQGQGPPAGSLPGKLK